MASFQSQYGIRLSSQLAGMKWSEFRALMTGLSNDSPLGKIICIRAEDDPKILKEFSKSQREIRNKWRMRKAKTVPQKDLNQFLASMEDVFRGMSGGVNEEDKVP